MCDKQKEEMERLFESFIKKLAITNTSFVRSLMNEIEWEARLIGIKGARGVGKTTLLLQYIKLNLSMDKTVLYASFLIKDSNNRSISSFCLSHITKIVINCSS